MPFHVFDQPGLGYEVTLCGRAPGPVETHNGWPLVAPSGLEALDAADTVIVPAFSGFPDGLPADVIDALRAAHRGGARIVSICTGAFALAEAGLLDGRRATTHWEFTDELVRRYPAVSVDPDALYVDEGRVVTSAGVASGIDLCLHLLRADRGAAVANSVARRMVAAPSREGGQTQFIRRPPTTPASANLAATVEWALGRLDDVVTVADLARHSRLSARTFARRFVAEMGSTPIKWLNGVRVDRARELLETTNASIDDIARASGLGSAANLREHFRRVTGTSPRAYRRAFMAT
ncbi:GlxA family transcriptional regulator [Leifsonia sp. ZF2019]|uniref:GlxA family transcriptional regulator n=1 Tax=Leifsonia sp. ZF2019 TaxID=2781978 RepID=UPI001CC0CAE4|nr:helix-turn-helix domain-containing protein [Leifsonia sp. ZF2019]